MRQTTNWSSVSPGDIISFRYRTKGELKLHTILLMGVQIPYTKKDGTSNKHVVGLKIESRNLPVSGFQSDAFLKEIKKLGDIMLVKKTKANEAIVRVNIGGVSAKRRVQGDFRRIESYVKSFTKKSKQNKFLSGGYRTYDWENARGMAVYFEPIIVKPNTISLIEEGKFEN